MVHIQNLEPNGGISLVGLVQMQTPWVFRLLSFAVVPNIHPIIQVVLHLPSSYLRMLPWPFQQKVNYVMRMLQDELALRVPHSIRLIQNYD